MSHRKFTRDFLLALLSVCFLALGVLACSAFAGLQEATKPTMTNDDVIKMVQVKLGDGVIIAKIKSSACKFDTSTDALIKLKEAGVSDAVMQAMAEAGTGTSSAGAAPAPPPDPNDPNAEHDPGIYYVHQKPDGREMVQLEPTNYSGAKTGGMFTSALTRGITKRNIKVAVRGGRASIRITDPTPTFYFYFERKSASLSYSAGWESWFAGTSSPNQFTLARFESRKDDRELVVYEEGAFRASKGTRGQDVVEFDFQKMAPGIYQVRPRTDMEPGEYCFIFNLQNAVRGGGGGSLFDFGVNPAE